MYLYIYIHIYVYIYIYIYNIKFSLFLNLSSSAFIPFDIQKQILSSNRFITSKPINSFF